MLLVNIESEDNDMTIKGMRWGYACGGVACGPVEGELVVEFMVANDDGHLFFISGSQFTDCFKMSVFATPMFDLLMNLTSWKINFEHEFEKVRNLTIEEYDYEMYDYPEEMMKSDFLSVFKLAHKALEEMDVEDGEDYSGAQEFIETYLDQDVDKIEGLTLPAEIDNF